MTIKYSLKIFKSILTIIVDMYYMFNFTLADQLCSIIVPNVGQHQNKLMFACITNEYETIIFT